MSGITKSVCATLFLAAALMAPSARADIARPDVSCDTKGAACDNAAPNGVGDGVCTSGVSIIAFGSPSCGPAEAAGSGQTECLFCKAAGGGAGGAGSGAAGAGASTSAGATNTAGATSKPASGDDGGGCSVRQLGSERGVATFMLGLGLAALAIGRRRR